MKSFSFGVDYLARRIVEKHGGSIKDRKEQVAMVFDMLREIFLDTAAQNGDRCVIKDFGIFKRKTRAGRMATNPQTGEAMELPPKKLVAFKPAASFSEELNAIE